MKEERIARRSPLISSDDVHSPVLRSVFDYWQSLLENGSVRYERFDICCVSRPAVPHLILIEPLDRGADFLFRVVGSHIDDNNGFAMTGKLLSAMPVGGSDELSALFNAVLADGTAHVSRGDFVQGDIAFKSVERLLMPLKREPEQSDLLLIAMKFERVRTNDIVTRMDASEE